MIVIGYQGIGKSTLCKNDNSYIDLESSNFWVDGKRADDWYKPYCNIAEDLSRQGHVVFVSSHEVVRNRLLESDEFVLAVVPAPTEEMKKVWISRLQHRYDTSKLEKDYKALMNARDMYLVNVLEITNSGIPCVTLVTSNYDLAEVITKAWYDQKRNSNEN
jgi:hypothetical protein